MTEAIEAGRCLNCGATLHGPFCAGCGQRAVPPHPTVAELAGDAWRELSGYDGRIMATVRGLLRPGFLTREYLEGRRAQYLPPLRVYLVVSVIYFLAAAAAPEMEGGIQVGVTGTAALTDQDRAELRAQLDESAWFVRPMLEAISEDPAGFRARVFTLMPRVFFVLVPIFAAILALFYRGRTFPTALVFATHVHAFAFIVFAIGEAAKFTRSEIVTTVISVPALVAFVVYVLMALREVFGGGWLITIVKALGTWLLYLLASVPAFIVLLLWASL